MRRDKVGMRSDGAAPPGVYITRDSLLRKTIRVSRRAVQFYA